MHSVMLPINFLLSVIMLSILFYSKVYAIQCYSCESVYEPNCGENFEMENHFQLDCAFSYPPRFLDSELINRNATACLKRIFNEHGVRKIVRSCFFGDVNETDVGCRMDPTLLSVEDVTCHVCDSEDFCNGVETQQLLEKWKIIGIIVFILTAKIYRLD